MAFVAKVGIIVVFLVEFLLFVVVVIVPLAAFVAPLVVEVDDLRRMRATS